MNFSENQLGMWNLSEILDLKMIPTYFTKAVSKYRLCLHILPPACEINNFKRRKKILHSNFNFKLSAVCLWCLTIHINYIFTPAKMFQYSGVEILWFYIIFSLWRSAVQNTSTSYSSYCCVKRAHPHNLKRKKTGLQKLMKMAEFWLNFKG
jgi:hypothetical protein